MVLTPPSLRRRAGALAGVVALLTVAACSAGPAETFGSSPQAIAGGTVDLAHDHVFLLASRGGLCTSTLIAPNLLLTARHCVSPGTGDDHVLCGDSVLGEPFPAESFMATNDPYPSRGSTVFGAAEVRVPGEGVDTCGYDIALVILNENVPSSVSAPAVPRIERDVTPGEKYTAVGYGVNEDGDPSGSRMQRAGLTIDCQPGSCGEGVESTEFRGETGICSGDSGGPALDTDGKVVGVVSRGGPDCSTPVYGTVTAWRDFIIDTALDAAQAGGYDPPFWVTTRSSELPVEGGAGGAGAAEPRAAEGESCQSTGECEDGLVCYGNGTGVCQATCESTADCGVGQVCEDVGGASLCVAPERAGEDSGCAVSPGSSRGGALALALLGALAIRRQRSRAHGNAGAAAVTTRGT